MNRYRLAALIDNVPNTLVGDTRPYALRIADAVLAAFEVLELPLEEVSGTYTECSVEDGDEIVINRQWVNPQQARILAADLLRSAAQIEAQS